jgi:hypothetical protein
VPLPFSCESVNDNFSAGVVYRIALIAVLWLDNILESSVFKICVNDFRYFSSLVLLKCRDNLLIGYIIHTRMIDRNLRALSSNKM